MLGYLSLTVSSVEQLKDIKDLYVIETVVYGGVERDKVLAALPRTWIINGKYISMKEHTKKLTKILAEGVSKKKAYFFKEFISLEGASKSSVREQQKLHCIIEDLEYKCKIDWDNGVK